VEGSPQVPVVSVCRHAVDCFGGKGGQEYPFTDWKGVEGVEEPEGAYGQKQGPKGLLKKFSIDRGDRVAISRKSGRRVLCITQDCLYVKKAGTRQEINEKTGEGGGLCNQFTKGKVPVDPQKKLHFNCKSECLERRGGDLTNPVSRIEKKKHGEENKKGSTNCGGRVIRNGE